MVPVFSSAQKAVQPVRTHKKTLASLPESQGIIWQEARLEDSQPWLIAQRMPFLHEGPGHQNRT